MDNDDILCILAAIGGICLMLILLVLGWFVLGWAVLLLNDQLLHWDIDEQMFHTIWLTVLGSAFIFACSHSHKDSD